MGLERKDPVARARAGHAGIPTDAMTPDHTRLRAIFSGPGWARFIAALREHRDRGRAFPSTITLRDPTREERRHFARLLRLPDQRPAVTLRCDLRRISEALLATGLNADWDEILTLLHGPVPPDKLAARTAGAQWQRFWPGVTEELEREPFPAWREWCESLRRDGSLKRLSGGDAETGRNWILRAARLLRALPLRDEQPLPRVAADWCGDSHALDPGSAVATLVLRGLALRRSQLVPARSDERRELWAAHGVICDELSAPVLTFNLSLTGSAMLCRLTEQASAERQPLHLTSRMLWAADWSKITCPREVFVCENPAIVSLAAQQPGIRCAPLVCVNGEPRTAARLLLRRLRQAGATLWYHGDFDWPGIAIAGRIFTEFGAQPWRFDAHAYVEAVRRPCRALTGTPAPSPWSPQLSTAMQETGLACDEELLANVLLNDLEC